MMATFKDARGVEWTLNVNLGQCWRLKHEHAINLLDVETLSSLLYLPDSRLYPALYALLEPQRKARGISDDAFADGLVGTGVDAAQDALEQEMLRFFSGRYAWLGEAIMKLRAEAQTRVQLAMQALDQAMNSGSGSTKPPEY